jgi:hypothetical protein
LDYQGPEFVRSICGNGEITLQCFLMAPLLRKEHNLNNVLGFVNKIIIIIKLNK